MAKCLQSISEIFLLAVLNAGNDISDPLEEVLRSWGSS